MGKLGRITCIFLPFVLTLASLVCICIVFLGGTKKSDSTLAKYYFFKANTANFTTDATSSSTLDSELLTLIDSAKSTADIADYYAIYLWNYCDGDSSNGTTATNNNYTYCSSHTSSFWFNPVEVWGLNSTGIESLFPSELKKGLSAYHTASHWMYIAYVVALIATIAELVVSVFAVCSRWGSFITTIASSVSSLFIFLASLTATILFATLVASFNSVLKDYGIKMSLGYPMLVTTWLAVLFSWAGGFFWLLSVCCCSGRSPYHKDADRSGGMRGAFSGAGRMGRGVKAEKAPYTYERVGESPYGQQQSGIAPGYGQETYAAGHQRGQSEAGYAAGHQRGQSEGAYGASAGHYGGNVPMINLQRASRDLEGQRQSKYHAQGGAYEPFRSSSH